MSDTNTLLPDIRLRFNIDHPNYEDCYTFGYECATADISEAENPFHVHSKQHEQWLEGWWAGFYGEEPLFELTEELDSQASNVIAANDHVYHEPRTTFFTRMFEITGMLAVSAAVGYQLLDLVA